MRRGKAYGLATAAMLGMLMAQIGVASQQEAQPAAELGIQEISPWTLRLILLPIRGGPAFPMEPDLILRPGIPLAADVAISDFSRPHLLSLKNFTVAVRSDPLTLTVTGPDGLVVQRLSFDARSGSVSFDSGARPLLGLGGGGLGFDRSGTFEDMSKGHRGGEYQIFGSRVPVPFLIDTEGWALFVHRPYNAAFDLRERRGRLIPKPAPDHPKEGVLPMDLFLIRFDSPPRVLREFYALTGNPALPPKWALGYQQSHRTLSGPEEVLDVASTFRQKRLPCDVLIYLGTGYCPAGWNRGHGSLEFNPATFPDPKDMIDRLHAMNFKVVLHKNRAPVTLHGSFPEPPGQEEGEDHVVNYWARHLEAFALGVDGWWPDDGDNLPIDSRLIRHMIYFEGSLADRPGVRPWSLHRTGYAGMARYGGWVWSGDVFSLWDTLAAHVAVGLNFSLSASPFWGTDIGGFSPTRELTGELYVRWFQFAAFNPLFRSHGRMWYLRRPWGWNTGNLGPDEVVPGHQGTAAPDADEVRNPEVEPICRQYLDLRYRLMPYTYSLAREACDTGLPLMRALWLHYPDNARASACGDEYLWGRDILVAPVTEKGAVRRSLYLPPGLWYDFWGGRTHHGGQTIERYVDLSTLPLYVRAGAILPMGPVLQNTDQPTDEPLEIVIYLGADGDFVLYEDDGRTQEYRRGRALWTRFRWDDRGRTLTIAPDERSDGSMIRPRDFKVRLVPGGEDRRIEYSGAVQAYRFQATEGMHKVDTASQRGSQRPRLGNPSRRPGPIRP